jgi:CubicO group peptidase (beta-lactamase class C family)
MRSRRLHSPALRGALAVLAPACLACGSGGTLAPSADVRAGFDAGASEHDAARGARDGARVEAGPRERDGGVAEAADALEHADARPLADAGDGEASDPFPVPDWPTATPAAEGIDAAGLASAGAIADADGSFCLLVIRHGHLVYENYWNGSSEATTNPSWSLAKSYTGTLVGIALDRGDIHDITDGVATYVPEWAGTPNAAITIKDLLSMTSGLSWNVFEDYVTFATLTSNQTDYAVAQSVSNTPGTTWTYDNAAVQVFERVFENATGMQLDQYAETYLWSRIGMTSAHWAHDASGSVTAYANVLATCRDHARLGYLFLHEGSWAGQEVVSSAYVAATITPSQTMNEAYGYLWWLNAGTPAEDAMMQPWPGLMVPFAPTDLFAARGFGNQFIDVIPSLDLIVVRFGQDPLGHDADGGEVLGDFNLAGLIEDSKFATHDAILQPILAAMQ